MVFRLILTVLILVCVFLVPSVYAQPAPQFGLPLECEPGEDCWAVNFVDLDPSGQVQDYGCGHHSYDGHKGTDIAIRDLQEMEGGVPVVASAPGTVKGVRDGERDVDVSVAGKQSVRGKECGNGVVVSHGDGWETQYCHMRKGSIVVATGTRVLRGQKLGFVGLSGLTQFPHVHLSVRHRGHVVDPFIGNVSGANCHQAKRPLWQGQVQKSLSRSPTAIYNAGFAARPPKVKAARRGLYKDAVLSRRAPALVVWAEIYWPQKGDILLVQIFDPDGEMIFEHRKRLEKTRARQFFYAGKKRKPLFWPDGDYRGQITLRREKAGEETQIFKLSRRVVLK